MTRFAPLIHNGSLEDPKIPISSAEVGKLFDGLPSNAGPFVDEKKSLTIAAVWRAVNLIAGTIAALPLHAYKSVGDTREQMPAGSKAAMLLSNPHPDMTRFEWLELLLGHVLLWGNAYCLLTYDGNGKPYLLPLHPSTVKPSRSKGIKSYEVETIPGPLFDADLRGNNPRARILHIPGFGFDGVKGISAIKAARQGLGLALAAEEFGARLFANGALSTGIVTTDKSIGEPQMKALAAQWEQKRKGLDKAFQTIFLDGGLKYQQLTIPPEDAQFLQSRTFQIDEIGRWYGVPSFMLNSTEKSTSWGTGIEQQQIGFLKFTLSSWLERFEQRFTKLLPPEPAYAKFGVEGLLRGDSAARAAFYKEMWMIGALSINDILRFEDMPPVAGGDVHYVPLNMIALGATPTQTGA